MKNKSTRRGFTQIYNVGRGYPAAKAAFCWAKPNLHTNNGFTLIELLVVVLIIGILAAVALPQYQKAVKKAHLAEWATYLNSYTKAIDAWLLANGYPAGIIEFTGTSSTSPRIHADLDLDFVCGANAEQPSQCLTRVGQFHAGCGTAHCWTNLVSSNRKFKLIKYDESINVTRFHEDNTWTLHSIVSTDVSLKKLICQYWKEHYGVDRMREDAQTACAAVGVN